MVCFFEMNKIFHNLWIAFFKKVYNKLGNVSSAMMSFSWATDLDPKGASSQIKDVIDPSVSRMQEDR